MPVRILVVDDHEIVRKGVRSLLEGQPDWEVCGEASNGNEAIQLAQQLNPDIIIMDVTMPGTNGLKAALEISRLGLRSRVLMFTMHEFKSLDDAVRKAGTHGFVLKSRAAHDLILALRTLLAGGVFYGSTTDGAGP